MRTYQVFRCMFYVACLFVGSKVALLPLHPGQCSNVVAWLESDGAPAAYGLGAVLLLIGFLGFFAAIRAFRRQKIVFHKGILRCSIDTGLLQAVVAQLWQEYFGRADLDVRVFVRGQALCIAGTTTRGWDSSNELLAFLSRKIFTSLGYWGAIELVLSEQSP